MARIKAGGGAAALLLALCVAGPARAQKDTRQKDSRLVRDGVALHNAGRYDDAIARYAEAYHRNPSLTRLLLLMGASYLNLGRLEDAVDHYERYERAAGARGADEDARLQGYYAEAGDKLDEALRREPARPALHLLRARVFLAMRRPDEAVAAAERFEALAPAERGRARPLYDRALSLLLARLPGEAGGGDAETLLRIGRLYERLGRPEEAARYLARHRALTAPPPRVALRTPAPEAPRRPLWRLLTGSVLLGGGLVTAGFGVSGLAADGQCIWARPAAPPLPECSWEFDTRGIGAGLLVGGVVVAAAGALLIALPPRRAAARR